MDNNDMMDSITKLNTELNKSMTLRDEGSAKTPKSRSRKSIILDNPTTSSASIPSTPGPSSSSDNISPRKSLSKTPTLEDEELDSSIVRVFDTSQEARETAPAEAEQVVKRPQNIEELMETESLEINTTPCALNVPDISEDDALWLIDVPRTIDPRDFEGQMLNFYDKSKLKAGGERYVAVPHVTSDYFTCVLGTGLHDKPWQAINITPQGSIIVRKKISEWVKVSDSGDGSGAKKGVPFPKTLRTRHPLLGVILREKKKKKRSKLL